VAVVPRRQHLVIDPRDLAVAVPADAEAVAVGGHDGLAGMQALVDQRILGLEQQALEIARTPVIAQPTAHVWCPPQSGRIVPWPWRPVTAGLAGAAARDARTICHGRPYLAAKRPRRRRVGCRVRVGRHRWGAAAGPPRRE